MADPLSATMVALASGSLLTAMTGVAVAVFYNNGTVKGRRTQYIQDTAKRLALAGHNVVILRDNGRWKALGHTSCTKLYVEGAKYKVFTAPRNQTMIVKYRGKGGGKDGHKYIDKCFWHGTNWIAYGKIIKFYSQGKATCVEGLYGYKSRAQFPGWEL